MASMTYVDNTSVLAPSTLRCRGTERVRWDAVGARR